MKSDTETFIHETAVVDEGASVGDGARLWHFVHVCKDARIGERCILGQGVYIGPAVVIGNGVKIQNHVSVYTGVEVEDGVFLGPSCVFTNVRNPRAFVERKDEFAPTRIRRGATIGANATVVCGREVGEYAIVGAGAVVTRDVLPYEVLVGNPGRRLGWACRCGERLPDVARPACRSCGAGYLIVDGERCVPAGAV